MWRSAHSCVHVAAFMHNPVASINQASLIDQIGLMYRNDDGRTGAWPAGVLAAGGTPGAVAAAARVGSQRPPGPRADRPDRPSAEPGVLPPGSAAVRAAGSGASQLGGRARRLLHRGPRPLRRTAGGGGRGAAPGARAGRAAARRRAHTSCAGAVPVHRQRRPFPDGRGAGAAALSRPGAGVQRRQPPRVAAPEHGPGHGRARNRRPRPGRQAPERVLRGPVRLRDHVVRPGPRGLPGVPRSPPARPLEHSRSGRGRRHRGGELSGLPGHRGRTRDADRLPARRDRRHAGPVSVPEDPSGRPQPVPPPDPAPAPSRVSLATVLREWGRIGCIGFGGPPTHIKLLRELCVERRKWLDAQEFEDAIAACNLLPGPASTQLAIFCAWRIRGRPGALVGGAAFIVPGLVVILALSVLFLTGSPPLWVLGAGAGAGAAVPAVAVQAGWSLLVPSWRGRARTARWVAYLLAGAASAATTGPWLALILVACGVIELAAQRPRHHAAA